MEVMNVFAWPKLSPGAKWHHAQVSVSVSDRHGRHFPQPVVTCSSRIEHASHRRVGLNMRCGPARIDIPRQCK